MKKLKEIQKFNHWWTIIFELIIVVIMTIVLIDEYQNLGNLENRVRFYSIIISGVLVLGVFVFINMIKLKTEINEKGISYNNYSYEITKNIVAS